MSAQETTSPDRSTENLRLEKLKALLKELFQLDKPELDFGIYRILRARSAEVLAFLEDQLPLVIASALSEYASSERAALETELESLVKQAAALGADPKSLPKVNDLQAKLSAFTDVSAVESEIYDDLYTFFRRYYIEGDFLSKRVYKEGVYAFPYEGEEVKLYWANDDQYYIKTSEYLRDYAFRLRPDARDDQMRVHFKLVDAAEGQHGNIGESDAKRRVFVLTQHDPVEIRDERGTPELIVKFEYRPARMSDWSTSLQKDAKKPPNQKQLIDIIEQRVLEGCRELNLSVWTEELGRVTGQDTDQQTPRIRLHLNRYVARNTFDYFIHKDLGRFLRRELDFYIKNEIMHLDDMQNQSGLRVEQYLGRVNALRRIADKVITFLSQVEDFQKKLWLKKKFVIDTRWCVTLGTIAQVSNADARRQLLQTIGANQKQREEWLTLNVIDRSENGASWAGGTLSPELLLTRPSLMIDTRHFSDEFKNVLLDNFEDIEAVTDGVLFSAENFQALNLMQRRYHSSFDCIYIDPPFNAQSTEIAYKNSYKHSSWLALIENRVAEAAALGSSNFVFVVAIDEVEQERLGILLSAMFPDRAKTCVTVVHNATGQQGNNFSATHEYAYFIYPAKGKSIGLEDRTDNPDIRPLRNVSIGAHLRTDAANCFYPVLIKDGEIIGFGDVSPDDFHPGSMNVQRADGVIEVYPVDPSGLERKYVFARDTVESILGELKPKYLEKYGLWDIERTKTRFNFKTVWTGEKYSANSWGSRVLNDILGENDFTFPKSIFTVRDCVDAALGNRSEGGVLDFFAGSGTTGHAVIMLNREDGGRRKFTLVEVEAYFASALLPRLKKVTFTPEWSDAQPRRLASENEIARGPRVFKIVTLESYEDTLNNLDLRRTEEQHTLLESLDRSGSFIEDYLLRYSLDLETRGALLPMSAFIDPTKYALKVKPAGSDETHSICVDLIETFNWLLGLTVIRTTAPEHFSAEIERDSQGRLRLASALRRREDGAWWFRYIYGTTPEGRKAAIIWRNRPGGDDGEGLERDNVVLNAWFVQRKDLSEKSDLDVLYVNGDNTIQGLRKPGASWSVKLTENQFSQLMFSMAEN